LAVASYQWPLVRLSVVKKQFFARQSVAASILGRGYA
jgi:hypothetical protein